MQTTPPRQPAKMFAARATAAALLALVGGVGAGCYRSALRTDDARSQFDRYDQARNERAPSYVTDEFGRRQPNLRGRLLGND